MNNVDIVRIKEHFTSIAPRAEEFSDIFYGRLFDIQPDFVDMFPSDLTAQKQKLLQALTLVVNGCDKFEKLVPVLQNLGQKHIGYGVSIEDYEYVGQSILYALKQVSDNWSEGLDTSWSLAYNAISDAMQS